MNEKKVKIISENNEIKKVIFNRDFIVELLILLYATYLIHCAINDANITSLKDIQDYILTYVLPSDNFVSILILYAFLLAAFVVSLFSKKRIKSNTLYVIFCSLSLIIRGTVFSITSAFLFITSLPIIGIIYLKRVEYIPFIGVLSLTILFFGLSQFLRYVHVKYT